MSDMVERVALAMKTGLRDDSVGECDIDFFRDAARIAIEAMREPADDMVEGGFIAPRNFTHDTETVVSCYRAMIDAALKE